MVERTKYDFDHYLSIFQMLLLVAGFVMLLIGIPSVIASYWAYKQGMELNWNFMYSWLLTILFLQGFPVATNCDAGDAPNLVGGSRSDTFPGGADAVFQGVRLSAHVMGGDHRCVCIDEQIHRATEKGKPDLQLLYEEVFEDIPCRTNDGTSTHHPNYGNGLNDYLLATEPRRVKVEGVPRIGSAHSNPASVAERILDVRGDLSLAGASELTIPNDGQLALIFLTHANSFIDQNIVPVALPLEPTELH